MLGKDLTLPQLRHRSQLQLGFNPWPRNFHMPQVQAKKSLISKLPCHFSSGFFHFTFQLWEFYHLYQWELFMPQVIIIIIIKNPNQASWRKRRHLLALRTGRPGISDFAHSSNMSVMRHQGSSFIFCGSLGSAPLDVSSLFSGWLCAWEQKWM